MLLVASKNNIKMLGITPKLEQIPSFLQVPSEAMILFTEKIQKLNFLFILNQLYSLYRYNKDFWT